MPHVGSAAHLASCSCRLDLPRKQRRDARLGLGASLARLVRLEESLVNQRLRHGEVSLELRLVLVAEVDLTDEGDDIDRLGDGLTDSEFGGQALAHVRGATADPVELALVDARDVALHNRADADLGYPAQIWP